MTALEPNWDVLIIGAGAAGLMCAIESAKRGRSVLVLDHSNKVGKKILMSGGGRCNFTNLGASPKQYLSHNQHFCKSALSRYTQWHFLDLVKQYQIPFHEKTLGQLFCDRKSKDIVELLLAECQKAGVTIQLNAEVVSVDHQEATFEVKTSESSLRCTSLVIATGGLSIPTMGATGFGYQIAKQFGLRVLDTRAGLVPLTWNREDAQKYETLAGVSVEARVSLAKIAFTEGLLFTHRGLSGPSILQISSYWQPNQAIRIQLLPNLDWNTLFLEAQQKNPNSLFKTFLSQYLPKRLVAVFWEEATLSSPLKGITPRFFEKQMERVNAWQVVPGGTEGYRTAEVTLGGVDCDELSSKTLEARKVPGLYFIGEVVDVTGWLGGYNFQWAWSSGWAAGQVV